MIQKIDKQDMARLNRAATVRLVRQCGGLSRAELARRLKLTPTALTDIAGDLLRAGILREEESDRRGLGRPAARLALDPDWGCVLSLSLTHSLALGVVNLAGELVSHRVLARTVWGWKTYKSKFDTLVPAVVRETIEAEPRRVLGIGVISAGRVNARGIISYNGNLPRRDTDMAQVLAGVTRVPVHVDEEFRLLLLDRVLRDGVDARSSVISMSAGIVGYGGGHALFFNGQLYYGADGFAGNPALPLIHGEEAVRQMHRQINALGGDDAYLEQVRQRVPAAVAIYRKCVENYGYRLAQIANNFNPAVVLMYSPYAVLGETFLDDVWKEVRRHADRYNIANMDLRFGGQRTDRERLVAAATPVLACFLEAGDFRAPGPRARDARTR